VSDVSQNVTEIIEKIEQLTVLELADLNKGLQEKFDVSPAAPVAVAAAPVAGGDDAAEEKTEFDVELQSAGDKKIQVIKVVRELTSLGLKEAKELVDSAPSKVKEGISKEEAEAVRDKLTDVGAQVEIK
jgi:large subunit ribosomal protein L7/L12